MNNIISIEREMNFLFTPFVVFLYAFLNMLSITVDLNSQMIVVKGGEKTCAPAVTRRKEIGRMTVRPISFQREMRVQVKPRSRLGRGDSRTARLQRKSTE